MGRAGLQRTLGVVLSLGLLAWALRDVDLAQLPGVLARSSWPWLVAALGLDVVIFLLKALKWRYVMAPVARLPLASCLSGIAVGALAGMVLPLRLDEVVRAQYLGGRSGVSRATVLGTIVVERLVDVTSLLVAVALVALLLPAMPVPALVLLVCGAGAAALAWLASGRPLPFAAKWPGRLGEVQQALLRGLEVFPRRARLLGLQAFSLGEWLLTLAYVDTVLRAFDARLPPAGTLAVVTASTLSFAVPGPPGALGVFELLVKGALATGLGLDPACAMAIAVCLHAMLVLPVATAGALVLASEGIAPWRLRRLATRESA